MRRPLLWLTILVCLTTALSAHAATGKVIKVLPQLLDAQGRNSLAPSLYERDAYQAFLRIHTNQIAGMQFVVQWKTKGQSSRRLLVRVEAKGVSNGNLPVQITIEKEVQACTGFSHWATLYVGKDDYKSLGEVTCWRVTLWDGDQQIGEQKSFLW